MKEVATLILNRNLGYVTNRLVENILKFNKSYTDVYVIDSGSDLNKMSKYTSWRADWKDALNKGLRFNRGMNFGLSKLLEDDKFHKYKFFLLLTNDTIVEKKKFVKTLINLMNKNKKLGILSPCSKKWGEKTLLKNKKLKYFWYIHNNAYFIRKKLIEKLKNLKPPHLKNFFFDGNNFRGYGSESEIFLKTYKNNMSAGITSEVWFEENESYLIKKNRLIKTESFEKNLELYLAEGKKWLKKKYNLETLWDLNLLVKREYDKFFIKNKNLKKYKI